MKIKVKMQTNKNYSDINQASDYFATGHEYF